MLTPIRVRGKNNRDQSRKKQKDENLSPALPAPKRRPGRPRNSEFVASQLLITDDHDTSGIIATNNHQLSALEQLPTELLQTIFLLSRNINLPMSSLYLGSVLASPHLRTELVTHAFVDREYSEQHLYAGLQSGLLRQKWLTYEFFQRCQRTYLQRSAILIIQKYSGEVAQDVHRSNIKKITETFDKYYSFSHRMSMKLEQLHNSSGIVNPPRPQNLSRDSVFVGTNQKGAGFSIILELEGNGMYVSPSWVADPQENLWPKDHYINVKRTGLYDFYPVLSDASLSQCEIPEKLLHGPWTNERGHFLKLLLNAGATVNWLDGTSGEVAMRGLQDAIRENNTCAISVLRAHESYCKYSLQDAQMRIVRECIQELDTGRVTVEELTNPQAAWRIPAGDVLWDTFTVGVVPSTKHLKIAVLEKPANLEALKALLEGDGKTAIDCDDTEMVDWALGKRAEARTTPGQIEGSNIGEWLLDTLEVIRKKQKKS